MLQQLVNGITQGSLYALIALGFTLFFGVLQIIKFAQGDVYMVGAFASLIVLNALNASGWGNLPYPFTLLIALLAAIITCGTLGILLERLVLRRLRKAPHLTSLVAMLGCAIILREAVFLLYPNGANPQSFPAILPATSFMIGGVIVQNTQIFIVLLALILMLALHLLVTHTRFGRGMRAIAQNAEMAEAMGVNINVVIAVTFFIGSALGGIAGLMSGMYYSSIQFDMGFIAGIKGFTAAVLGGLGNIYGALVGAYLLAFLEVFGTIAIPNGSQYRDVFAFGLLVVFLVVRPEGIFGRPIAEKV
ncbi:branched-chain amino acid ABC transporter permease [Ktedonosporobacter rubrisoli]|uniref:Branched-chain amino acid ABC transporter permease n=1 Tax=Ktedonosporobacter rubrisoli TaxID=2509675 RepID=A0A4P6K0K5_KTERU|nr:branched-chain amino acid ABC transporter permease [Ktedonosporobacter rubrisoli]QBD81718.1 branched-chain amino acid ABC transporter permease [Ktedonosporobacter rubrisoli]